MKSYADQCLERASKATPGPWSYISAECADCHTGASVVLITVHLTHDVWATQADRDLMVRARTDVPELAKRLKRAIAMIRSVSGLEGFPDIAKGLRELEAPLQETGTTEEVEK